MKRRIHLLLVVALALFLSTAFPSSATPGALGAPTLRWVTTSATTAELRADGLTNGGTPGNGAISWDLYFRFPVTVTSPPPVVTITAGPAWTSMSPCTFVTNVSMNQPSAPGATGNRGVLINGFCTSGVPNNPVTGSNILVATITLASCPAGNAGFVMDLHAGDSVFGASVADFVDRSNAPFNLSDADLTDGTPMCPSALPSIDVDGNGSYDALTDGLLIIRYLFGLTDALLTNGAVGAMATRTTPQDILQYLNGMRTALDVDGNNQSDALTDGLMLLRYLFGLRGSAVSSGAIGVGATRSAPEIEKYIQSLMP